MLIPKGDEHMVEQDTIKLLRECDAGVKMGTASIDDVLDHVKGEVFRQRLSQCKQEHNELQDEIQQLLDRYQDEGKSPNPMVKGMSKMKTGMKQEDAERFVDFSDMPNVRLCLRKTAEADLTLRLDSAGDYQMSQGDGSH